MKKNYSRPFKKVFGLNKHIKRANKFAHVVNQKDINALLEIEEEPQIIEVF